MDKETKSPIGLVTELLAIMTARPSRPNARGTRPRSPQTSGTRTGSAKTPSSKKRRQSCTRRSENIKKPGGSSGKH